MLLTKVVMRNAQKIVDKIKERIHYYYTGGKNEKIL